MSNKGSEGDILRALALEDAIRHQMDDIVRQAADTVTLLKPGSEGKQSELRENQIRNVINVAEESQSVEVVTNFIRYQIGRSSSGRQWQYNGFGLQVIKDIEDGVVATAAGRAAEAATKAIGEGADEKALCRRAYLELTRHYLGYLNRAFYFCDKIETDNRDRARRGQEPLIDDPWVVVVRTKEVCLDV